MKRERQRKEQKSRSRARRTQRGEPVESSPASAHPGVTKQTRASSKPPSVASRSGTTDGGRTKDRSAIRQSVAPLSLLSSDMLRVAELIEACRAHVSSLTTLAAISSRTLFECYEYDADEPELWQCCHLVRRVLKQAHVALVQFGCVSHESDPHVRAEEIAIGCEAQRQWLRPAVHVVRATIHVLLNAKPDLHDEVLPGLRDLESGLSNVVNELQRVIQCCPCHTRRGGAR